MRSWLVKVGRGLSSWVFILALLWVLPFWNSRDMATGAPPESPATLMTGEPFRGFSGGAGPTVVYFWGSWCGVCKVMQPTLRALGEEGVSLLTVALQSGDAATVGRYMGQESLRGATVVDEEGIMAQRWGVRGVPAIFILDRNGLIRFSVTGYTTLWGLKARIWLAGLDG